MSNENKEKDNHRGNSGFLSGSHEDVVEQGKREVEAGFMPQINPISVNLADYDVIAIFQRKRSSGNFRRGDYRMDWADKY